MITGDQALTACHVAGQVNINTKPPLILAPGKNSTSYEWVSPDEAQTIGYRFVNAFLSYLEVFFFFLTACHVSLHLTLAIK